MSTFKVDEDIHIASRFGGHDFEAGEHTAATLEEEHSLHLAVKTGHASVVGKVEPPAIDSTDDDFTEDEAKVEEAKTDDAGGIVSGWNPSDPKPIEEEG